MLWGGFSCQHTKSSGVVRGDNMKTIRELSYTDLQGALCRYKRDREEMQILEGDNYA